MFVEKLDLKIKKKAKIDFAKSVLNSYKKGIKKGSLHNLDTENQIGNINNLKLGEPIGQGGFSTVFSLDGGNIPLAIKIIDTDEISQETKNNLGSFEKVCKYFEFERDAMMTCRNCENIMPLLGYYEYRNDSEQHAKYAYIMPKLQSIYDYLNRGTEEFRYINILKQICVALQFCENNGILHRDVKKENIFYYQHDGKYVFVLGDFGASTNLQAHIRSTVTKIGSYTIAPEIHYGRDLEGRFNSDLYSLGKALLYESINGTIEEINNLAFSDEFENIIAKLTNTDPVSRYQHGSEVIIDLDKLPQRNDEGNIFRIDVDVETCKKAVIDAKSINNPKMKDALALAKQGYEIGNASCTRIYAYILCCKYNYYKRCKSDIKNKVEMKKIIKEAQKVLYELVVLNDDITAKFLYAYISYVGKDVLDEDNQIIKKRTANFFKETADKGCPIAQYYYGKMLYKGTKTVKQNKELSIDYLTNSIAYGFGPALYYIQEIMKEDPSIKQYSKLDGITSMEPGEISTSYVAESFVKFL